MLLLCFLFCTTATTHVLFFMFCLLLLVYAAVGGGWWVVDGCLYPALFAYLITDFGDSGRCTSALSFLFGACGDYGHSTW